MRAHLLRRESPHRLVWRLHGGQRRQCPAGSRATATATIVRRLPRLSSACQPWWRRRARWSARARTAAGCRCRRCSRAALGRSGRRWCQAASTRSRRAWVLPVFVIAPKRRASSVESSLSVRPRNGPSDSGRNRCQSPSSTVSPSAVTVETPRRHDSRPTMSTNGGSAASSLIAGRASHGASWPAALQRMTHPTRVAAAGTRTAAVSLHLIAGRAMNLRRRRDRTRDPCRGAAPAHSRSDQPRTRPVPAPEAGAATPPSAPAKSTPDTCVARRCRRPRRPPPPCRRAHPTPLTYLPTRRPP